MTFSIFHPLYVSVTNMDVDAQSGNVALSIRIFTEDMETVLHNRYGIHGWIGAAGEHPDSRKLLREYVSDRFSVTANGRRLGLQTDSITIVDDMMWFCMSAKAGETIQHMEVDNRLLIDCFEKQNNLVIISSGSAEIGRRLNRKTHKFEIPL